MSGLSSTLLTHFPIVTLTMRHFRSGKAIRFVAFFALLPVLFGLIFLIDSGGDTARTFLDTIFREIVIPTLLPIATLILATSALGDEIEDRSLVYLILKPVGRSRIVLEKFAAVVQSTVLLLWLGLFATWILTARGDAGDSIELILAAGIAILLGVLAYGAVFLAISLIVPRALVVGIIYTLIWESLLSRPDLIPGLWIGSVRHYIQSFYVRILDDPGISLPNAVQLPQALVFIVFAIAIALVLATWRLRTMDLE